MGMGLRQMEENIWKVINLLERELTNPKNGLDCETVDNAMADLDSLKSGLAEGANHDNV